jgi:hypothetical protein
MSPGSSAAHELDDFHVVPFTERNPAPVDSLDDLPVDLHGDSLGSDSENSEQSRHSRRKWNDLLFAINSNSQMTLHKKSMIPPQPLAGQKNLDTPSSCPLIFAFLFAGAWADSSCSFSNGWGAWLSKKAPQDKLKRFTNA